LLAEQAKHIALRAAGVRELLGFAYALENGEAFCICFGTLGA
jgi:hypothetical protein